MMPVEYHNPDTLHHNPAFTQAISVTGAVRTVYVGGQNAVTAAGEIVGQGDLKAQVEQVLNNLQYALDAAGAKLEHVVKWNINVVQGQSVQEGFEVFQQVWGQRGQPPVITVAFVAGLAHPDYLCELEAIAVIPAG